MVSLTKTNKWRNLKRKAKNVKDIKEQEAVNESLMTTIEVLDQNVESLVTMHNQCTKVLNGMNDALGTDHSMISGGIIPVMLALNADPKIAELLRKELGEEKYNYIFGKEDKPDESGV